MMRKRKPTPLTAPARWRRTGEVMMKRTLCLLMVALAPLAAAAEAAKAPVVVVPPSDPRIQYIGRFDVSKPDAQRFAW